MNITLQVLGDRLKDLRKALDLSQENIAEKLNEKQNTISRIENGVGGTIDILLKLINFYSNYYNMDKLFSNDFAISEKDKPLTNSLYSVAIEKLKLIKEELDKEISGVIELLDT